MTNTSEPTRILVVDDDPIFSALAASRLGAAGYVVQLAGDGVDALQMLDQEHFHLAVIDLSMPRIDGFRLIGLIRGAQRLRSLAIIVVSSRNDEVAFHEAMALGANDYATKPVDWVRFPDRVRGVLEQIKSQAASNQGSNG